MTWRARLRFEKRDLWFGVFWDLKPRSAWIPVANGIYEVCARAWLASGEAPGPLASTQINGVSTVAGDCVLVQEEPPRDLHLYICLVPCLPLHVWRET